MTKHLSGKLNGCGMWVWFILTISYSVPEEMLLPCSVLADAYINKSHLPESLTVSFII